MHLLHQTLPGDSIARPANAKRRDGCTQRCSLHPGQWDVPELLYYSSISIMRLMQAARMSNFHSRADLISMTVAGEQTDRSTGRQLRRLHRRSFALFRGGVGTGVGVILIITGILALAFIIYSIWLRRKKQRERQIDAANKQYLQYQQEQQLHQSDPNNLTKPYYSYTSDGQHIAPTV
jgi:hypothetical protein